MNTHHLDKLNRSPDPSGASEVDPLAGAASGWEAPKFPVLADNRLIDVEIVEATKAPVKDDAGKAAGRETLTLKLKTVKDYPDKDGKPLRAGFTGFHRIGLSPIEGDPTRRDRTLKDVGADLAVLLRCCGGPLATRTPRDVINDPSILLKSIITVKTKISPAQGGFPESNNFTLVPPEKSK
jgi:hypothetical protein